MKAQVGVALQDKWAWSSWRLLQIAANHKGSSLLNELMDDMGEDVVVAYMKHIQVTCTCSCANSMRVRS